MARSSQNRDKRREHRVKRVRSPYVLIARGPDGWIRAERFHDAASYRSRLADLERSRDGAVSVDEIVNLFDA